jgi:RNA 3'-terminal phosphate cyclase (ATP)
MLELDGSMGEGGGQVLRSALALSLSLGLPFHLRRVRAGREKPGPLRQHLACVRAAAAVGEAEVEGAELGSREVRFRPGPIRPGRLELGIGSAGSAILVLQTVLLPLALAHGESQVVIQGGTHNPLAPPWPFFERVVLPALRGMGIDVEGRLLRAGFHPAGGGSVSLVLRGVRARRWHWRERGDEVRWSAEAQVAGGLSMDIARREIHTCLRQLGPELGDRHRTGSLPDAGGPGNIVLIEAEMQGGVELFTALGRRGRSAEDVALDACAEARAWQDGGAPVGPHLADQLLLPLALLGGGSFLTGAPTLHTRTQVALLAAFGLDGVRLQEVENGRWLVEVPSR